MVHAPGNKTTHEIPAIMQMKLEKRRLAGMQTPEDE
jgi:hypothetical protein